MTPDRVGDGTYPINLPSITSLRYIAAAWVVVFHFQNFVNAAAIRTSTVVQSGYLGVDFFFILSGFILTHVYKTSVDGGRFDYWMFLSKRIGRIYPMHLLMLAVFIVGGAAAAKLHLQFDVWDPSAAFATMEKGALIRAIVANVTLIQAWGSTDGLYFNLPSWSISAEWFAYLLFPFAILVAKGAGARAGRLLAAAVLSFLVICLAGQFVMRAEVTRMSWNIGILRIAPEFFTGVCAYYFGSRVSFGRRGAAAGLVVSALLAIAITTVGQLAGQVAISAALTVVCLGGVILFAADCDRQKAAPALAHPFFVYLGEISYSVYMVHLGVGIFLFEVLAPRFRPTSLLASLGLIAAGLVAATLASALTHRFVEIPAQRLIVGQAGRMRSQA